MITSSSSLPVNWNMWIFTGTQEVPHFYYNIPISYCDIIDWKNKSFEG